MKDLLRYFLPDFSQYFLPFFPVPVFFWWVERMYWQVRVSSLLSLRRPKAFFRFDSMKLLHRNGQLVKDRDPGCYQHCARLYLLHLTTCRLPPCLPLSAMGRDSPCSRAPVCFTPSPPSTCQPALLPITFVPSRLLAARGVEQAGARHPGCFPPPGDEQLPNCQTHIIFPCQTSVKALSVEVWGLYAGLVLRDENFAGHLAAVEPSTGDFEAVEEGKTCLRDGSWLDNARAQVNCEQSNRKSII